MPLFVPSALTSSTGTSEPERSALGELDGASGSGTAVAVEYLHNSGGPGSGNYDRARSLQGKGVTSNTLNGSASSGQNQAFLNSGAVPVVGQPVYLLGGTAEVAYVLTVVGQTLTFTSNLANTHGNSTTVSWDTYSGPLGPGLNGFLPTGVSVAEGALFDPVSGLFYAERSATQDAVAGANVMAGAPALWNGATFDRWKSSATTGTALVATGMVSPGVTLNAVAANTTGTTVDSGAAHSNWTAVAVATGSPTAGTITLEISMDNTTWISSTATANVTAAGNFLLVSTGRAARYARCSLTSLTGTITLTVNMIAAG